MRTTLNLDEQLLAAALAFSAKKEKTAVIHAALKAFIEREASRSLASAGGSDAKAAAASRKRPWLDAA